MTGIGPVPVKVPRVWDRGAGHDKITFTPGILPRYPRKAKSVVELLPWLYLKGVPTGDFAQALEVLLGPNATVPLTLTFESAVEVQVDVEVDVERMPDSGGAMAGHFMASSD